jgi:transposase-like protein
MAKNKVQFQKGYSFVEFFQDYGTEEQCVRALYQWRWPTGFVCPNCHSTRHCELKCRELYQCNCCRQQTSITSGTIFANTKLPLTKWLLAMHLLGQSKNGQSALSLKRALGVSYNTAWSMKHKIMQVMKERDDSKPLEGIIQLDDVYIGGEQPGGKRGRGAGKKTPVVAAVAVNAEGHPVTMNMQVVAGFQLKEIARWATQHVVPGSTVVSDGLWCFSAVTEAGCKHVSIVTGGGPKSVTMKEFTWVNTMIGNVKNAITGTYHSIGGKHGHKHLPRYLAEFSYRFNRRFRLDSMLPRLAHVALRTPPMPYRLLKLAEAYG